MNEFCPQTFAAGLTPLDREIVVIVRGAYFTALGIIVFGIGAIIWAVQ